MEHAKQFLTQTFVGVAQVLTPVLKESKFKETGVLTPDEFVAAGDHLVYRCPSWHWEKGDTVKDYLPADKQYLVTKNVPCYKRLKEVDVHTDDQEEIIELDDSGSGWVDTHHYMKHDDVCEGISEMKIDGKTNKEKPHIVDDDDDDEEAVDMEEFMRGGTVDDDDIAAEDEQPDIILTRTYDLHITYDKYYQTPRLWLIGYNKSRHPLTIEEMYEDISQDHARKTVTVESHPHITNNIPVATVHPCRHAEVMKRIIGTAAEGGKELGVHLYLLIFLKFMQAVIPTIEYDFTQSFAF